MLAWDDYWSSLTTQYWVSNDGMINIECIIDQWLLINVSPHEPWWFIGFSMLFMVGEA